MAEHLDASVVSERFELEHGGEFTLEQWSGFIRQLLERMIMKAAAGSPFMGHIKASLHVDRRVIFGSTTGGPVTLRVMDDPVMGVAGEGVSGEIVPDESVPALLKVALIAYKKDRDSLERCLQQSLAEVGRDLRLGYRVRVHDHRCGHAIE